MKLIKRGGIAAMFIAGAMLIAAGCGGSDSGASGAAKNGAALDFVPSTAIGYVTFDTDIEGDAWSAFADAYPAFNSKFVSVEKWADEALDSAYKGATYKEDVEPWLGDNAGVAFLTATGAGTDGKDPQLMAWVELEDSAAFEDFAKKNGFTKGSAKVNDFQIWSNEKTETFVGVSKDLALLAMTKKDLTKTIGFDGESIKDAPGVSDAVDELGKDSIATAVVGGKGVRAALKEEGTLSAAANAKQIKDLEAFAFSFGAQKDGLRVDGYVSSAGEDLVDNEKRDVFEQLPAGTLFALGGNDLGGGLKSAADEAGKQDPQVQQTVGLLSGVLGVDIKDLAKAFDGEFALGVSADDQGLAGLAGGAAGAAMGGGLGAIDPAKLASSAAITLAFEKTDSASETLDKVVGSIGGLTGATGGLETGTAGDFTTKRLNVQGLPVTTGASDDVAAVVVGADVFTTWGKDTLGDNDAFKDAWKAADAPDKTLGSFWLDFGRVGSLVGIKSADDMTPGGWVGWLEADGSNAKFGVFMHVEKK